MFVETYLELFGSHLGTWPRGHGLDPRPARGDMNVLPDPLCLAAACDKTHIPVRKQNRAQIHCYEVINFS